MAGPLTLFIHHELKFFGKKLVSKNGFNLESGTL